MVSESSYQIKIHSKFLPLWTGSRLFYPYLVYIPIFINYQNIFVSILGNRNGCDARHGWWQERNEEKLRSKKCVANFRAPVSWSQATNDNESCVYWCMHKTCGFSCVNYLLFFCNCVVLKLVLSSVCWIWHCTKQQNSLTSKSMNRVCIHICL